MAVRVDDAKHLIISTASVAEAGDVTAELSALLPGGSSALQYKQILALNLPSVMHILAYRNIVIPGLKMTLDGQDGKSMKEGDIPNAVANQSKSGEIDADVSWYGTLDKYFNDVYNGGSGSGKLFTYDSNLGFCFSQGVAGDGGSFAEVLVVPMDDGSELVVLKLKNCFVEGTNIVDFPTANCPWIYQQAGNQKTSRLLKGCRSDDDVKEAIKNDGAYWAYGWNATSQWVTAYHASDETKITYSENERNCVFFVAESCTPIMSLVND